MEESKFYVGIFHDIISKSEVHHKSACYSATF